MTAQDFGSNIRTFDVKELKTKNGLSMIDDRYLVVDVVDASPTGKIELVETIALSLSHKTDAKIYGGKLELLRVDSNGTAVFMYTDSITRELHGKPYSEDDDLSKLGPLELNRADPRMQVAVFRLIRWTSVRRE